MQAAFDKLPNEFLYQKNLWHDPENKNNNKQV